MRHVLPCTFFLGVLLAVPTATEAQNLGTAFTYQGELKAAGEAAQGLFDFEACLFDTPVIPNSMPLLCVEQANRPVGGDGQGRFTLSLDFGAAFDGSVRYLEIRVRPAGVGGTFTALLPRHEIRPTPEALRAASAPWSGIAGAAAGFSDNIDNDSGGDITAVIAGTGLSGGDITGDATLGIADGGVGLTQINTAQVQARVNASCPDGEAIASIGDDGSVSCISIPAAFAHVIDAANNVGSDIDLALRNDDRPVLAYYYASATALRLHLCANRACSDGVTRNIDASGDVGRGVALALTSDGRPVVAYQDTTNLALKLYTCDNADCSLSSRRTLDDTRDVTTSIDLVIRNDGRPLVVYGDNTNFEAQVYDCADVSCSSGTRRYLTSSMFVGSDLAIELDPAGLPVIAKGGNAGGGVPIYLVRCSDVNCAGAKTVIALASKTANKLDLIIRSNDRALIATTGSGVGVEVLECTNATCSAVTAYPIDTNASDRVSLVEAAAQPALAFRRFVAADQSYLRLHRCVSSSCLDGSSRVLDGGPGEAVGNAAVVAVRSDGRPVVAHYDSLNEDLLLHVCGNPNCL